MEFLPTELAKLPKWAVSRIQNVEAQLARVQEQLDIATGVTPTSVYQHTGYDFDAPKRYLDQTADVVFAMADKYRSIEVRMVSAERAKSHGPHIRVTGCTGSLRVAPECSNVVLISLAEV